MTKHPLIFLPGMLCDERLWQPILSDALHSQCDISSHELLHDNLQDWAQKTLPSLPQQSIIAGLSMGGYAALELTRLLIENQDIHRLRGLILIATSAKPDTAAQSRLRRGLIQLAKKGTFKGVTPKLLPTLIHASLINNDEPANSIYAMADDLGSHAFITQETAVMNRRDQRDILPHIPCPALIICGDSDSRTPKENSQELAKLIPHSELHIIENCGHLPPLERPKIVQPIIEKWLNKLS